MYISIPYETKLLDEPDTFTWSVSNVGARETSLLVFKCLIDTILSFLFKQSLDGLSATDKSVMVARSMIDTWNQKSPRKTAPAGLMGGPRSTSRRQC